ncbi:MAG: hypothetical protein AAFP00_03440 [Bacteroidota bacterium]
MDKILELLKDPSWWFSALFIAIMASVIAAFLKDWISSIISIFSSSYRDWSNKKAIEQNKYIQELAGNSTLLIISYFRVMVGIILFTSCFLAYLLFQFGEDLVSEKQAFSHGNLNFLLLSFLPFQ